MAAFDSSFDSSFDIGEPGSIVIETVDECPPWLKPEYTVQTSTVTDTSITFDVLVEGECPVNA